jgi:hypothetical protein
MFESSAKIFLMQNQKTPYRGRHLLKKIGDQDSDDEYDIP